MQVYLTRGTDDIAANYDLDDDNLWDSLSNALYNDAVVQRDEANARTPEIPEDEEIVYVFTSFYSILESLLYCNTSKLRLGRTCSCKPSELNKEFRENGPLIETFYGMDTPIPVFDSLTYLEYFNERCRKKFNESAICIDECFGIEDEEDDEINMITTMNFSIVVDMFCSDMKKIFGNRIPLFMFPTLNGGKEWHE